MNVIVWVDSDDGDGDDDEGIELFYSTNYPMPYSIAHPNIRTENK